VTLLEAGECLDHYRLDALVAQGGMASVYRATDIRTGRQCAIKIPHQAAECDIAGYDRFQREAAICRELDHPGVLKAISEEGQTQVYMAMEWVDGQSLRQILSREGRLPVERAKRIALAVCSALEHIHTHGVVHRDLKPENVIIDSSDDHVKLIDFGIARKSGSRRLTFGKLSNVMGTADYISPEQVRSRRGDARSDLYSLGIMLYEMLTGETPFDGDNPFAVMNARLHDSIRPASEIVAALPRQFDAVLQRALERDPDRRYVSASEFAYDLEHLDQIDPTRCSKPRKEAPYKKWFAQRFLLWGR